MNHSSPSSPTQEVNIPSQKNVDSNRFHVIRFFFGIEYSTSADLPGPTLLAAETEITADPMHVHTTGGLGDRSWKDLVQHRHD